MTVKKPEPGAGRTAPLSGPADPFGGIFGPPPLLPNEDPEHYAAIGERLRQAVQPEDFTEEIWLRDLQDFSWERWRWRRLKAQFVALGAQHAIETLLFRQQVDDAIELARKWAIGDPDAKATVQGKLDQAGLTMDAVHGLALSQRMTMVEQMSRMEERLEQRFAGLLREVENRRGQRRHALMRVVEVVRSGEHEEASPTGALAYAGR